MFASRGEFFGARIVDSVVFAATDDGLYARTVDEAGDPQGPATRIAMTCDAGFDVVASPADAPWFIACGRRADLAKDDDGAVFLFSLDDALAVTSRSELGTLGRDGGGVSVVRDANGPVVGWRDGTPGAWVAKIARPGEPPEALSAPHMSAGAPHLIVDDGDVVAVWSEMWIEAGQPAGHIVAKRAHRTREVSEIHFARSTPRIFHDSQTLVVAFRDARGGRPGLYVVRLGHDLGVIGEPRRVGRADGPGAPTLVTCGEDWTYSVAPRTWGKSDVLVGINALDAALRLHAPERQVYQWAAQFPLAHASCVADNPDRVLVLFTESSDDHRAEVGAHIISLDCAP